jgi:hypothetical protein
MAPSWTGSTYWSLHADANYHRGPPAKQRRTEPRDRMPSGDGPPARHSDGSALAPDRGGGLAPVSYRPRTCRRTRPLAAGSVIHDSRPEIGSAIVASARAIHRRVATSRRIGSQQPFDITTGHHRLGDEWGGRAEAAHICSSLWRSWQSSDTGRGALTVRSADGRVRQPRRGLRGGRRVSSAAESWWDRGDLDVPGL